MQQPTSRPLVCYKCGEPGHIAARCTSGGSGGGGQSDGGAGVIRGERRVDVCGV